MDLTPKQIVEELNKYIIGQEKAKKAIAVALRNRYRSQKLPLETRKEITPKNIIMIGPTGVGKTEISRRIADLYDAPFLKIEITKFTEVGYVGRDVESMIRDLVNLSVSREKAKEIEKVQGKAHLLAQERILDILLPYPKKKGSNNKEEEKESLLRFEKTRKKLKQQLEGGLLEDRVIEIEVRESVLPIVEVFSGSGIEGMDMGFSDALGSIFPQKTKRQKKTISEGRRILINEEASKLIDMDEITKRAITKVEELGIIFLDEIDKIASSDKGAGPDVSRQGVQRDILPIVEGSCISTKYGTVMTNHILFIAAGTFHNVKPSDLIPELQGRFPIRVELSSLTMEDFKEILVKPRNAITKQYEALLSVEDIKLSFTEKTIDEIASFAYLVNTETENIGARRLHTIIEKVLEDISFEAPDLKDKEIVITEEYVRERLKEIVKDNNLSRYIL
ncbi:ATP-dependent protease ATPase subunit HslU [bacterium]|nr:ATP-dependent protease ATPase subunit HslU [bacterium]MBU2599195.1 ATP-dependent protease ATPase subunit HslU [bacterium]